MNDRPHIAIRPWEPKDLPLLERLLGDPEMMAHLGGPESAEAIRARHERYLASDTERGGIFAIVSGAASTPAGWVGYWETTWLGEDVWEAGWHVLPESQGHGVATAATRLMIARARDRHLHRFMHAFPAVDNAASNGVCSRLGFRLLGEVEVEYPPGSMMRGNDWCLDLEARNERPA